jgi:hypothetical protein
MALFGLCRLMMMVASGVSVLDEPVVLMEQIRAGDTAVVTLDFKAQGDMRFSQGKETTTHRFSANGRFVFEEKLLDTSGKGEAAAPPKSLRYYRTAAVESLVAEKRTVMELREPVRLIVGELRQGRPFLFSPAGPLTIPEHEMIEAEAQLDPLVLGGLLPTEAVTRGAKWRPGDAVVAAVFNLSGVTKNQLDAELESFDDETVRVQLGGKIEGTASGAATERTITGHLVFDRARSRITQLALTQAEERAAGPTVPALKATASSTLRCNFAAPIERLNDQVLEKLPLDANAATEQLVYFQPEGRYRFYLPRGWRILQSDHRVAVLGFIENDQMVSHCNVVPAPTVVAGTHMKADEFRSQVQQALGKQFSEFIQEGEVTASKGYWIYRLAAAGSAGDLPVVWYYYLAAGPQGQQLVFIFRVPAPLVEQFGAKDLGLVGSLEFDQARTAANRKQP